MTILYFIDLIIKILGCTGIYYLATLICKIIVVNKICDNKYLSTEKVKYITRMFYLKK